jgi:6-pyruvoyltetrahydropterin/6-carboxytetrahydropterin synthase
MRVVLNYTTLTIKGKIMYTIEKEFKFEYAHKLNMNYDSPCKNLHGHSAKVLVKIWATVLNENGMIIDFTHLKPFQTFLDQNFDHTTILNKTDDHVKLIKTNLNVINGDPTSENMSKLFHKEIKYMLNQREVAFTKIRVTFFETAKNAASYEG